MARSSTRCENKRFIFDLGSASITLPCDTYSGVFMYVMSSFVFMCCFVFTGNQIEWKQMPLSLPPHKFHFNHNLVECLKASMQRAFLAHTRVNIYESTESWDNISSDLLVTPQTVYKIRLEKRFQLCERSGSTRYKQIHHRESKRTST